MTKEQLIEKLKLLQLGGDTEAVHWQADKLLLEFINDSDIKEEYDKIDKWYA